MEECMLPFDKVNKHNRIVSALVGEYGKSLHFTFAPEDQNKRMSHFLNIRIRVRIFYIELLATCYSYNNS